MSIVYDGLTQIGFITVTAFFTLLTIPAIYLLGQLLFFHVRLSKFYHFIDVVVHEGTSTYDFIMKQREKEKEKRQKLELKTEVTKCQKS